MWERAKPFREEETWPRGSWAALWGRGERTQPVLGVELGGHLYSEVLVHFGLLGQAE